jgi:hypothetical protein
MTADIPADSLRTVTGGIYVFRPAGPAYGINPAANTVTTNFYQVEGAMGNRPGSGWATNAAGDQYFGKFTADGPTARTTFVPDPSSVIKFTRDPGPNPS